MNTIHVPLPGFDIAIARLTLDPTDHLPIDLVHLLALVQGIKVDERPIEIAHIDGGMHYKIINGRHRVLAAILKNKIQIRAVIVKPATFTHTPGAPHETPPPPRCIDHREP